MRVVFEMTKMDDRQGPAVEPAAPGSDPQTAAFVFTMRRMRHRQRRESAARDESG